MKLILAGTALALMASVAQAQQTALDVALAQNPVPCGHGDNIAEASYDTNDAGQTVVRVRCRSTGATLDGAPATNANMGFLAPLIGIGAVGAALALSGGGGGSSSSDTQSTGLN